MATESELYRTPHRVDLGDTAAILYAAKRVAPRWLHDESIVRLVGEGMLSWKTIETLIAEGLCTRPGSDRFIEAIVERTGFRSQVPLVEVLREMPGVLGDGVLYRLFEVEGGQRSSLAAADKYRRKENQWATALLALAEAGELNRARLLDASLDALARDFASFRAGWFARFHDKLAPTEGERAQRSAAYLRLLGSAIPATVSFAVKAVGTLVKKTPVDAQEVLTAMAPALLARQKGTVKQGVKLVKTIAMSEPSAVPRAIELFTDALIHPAPDVQEVLLDAVEALMPLAGSAREEFEHNLQSFSESISASLRSRLPSSPSPAEATNPDARPRRAALSALDESLRLSYATSADEAVEYVAYALEHDDEPLAQERAFDAIARFPNPDESGAALASPVRKRATALWKRHTRRGGLGTDHPMQCALVFTALAWTKREHPVWMETYYDRYHDVHFYLRRTQALIERVLANTALPLLSTPTHRSGFIDARAFHERLAAWSAADEPLDLWDVVLALMRLPASDVARGRAAIDLPHRRWLDLAAEPGECEFTFTVPKSLADDRDGRLEVRPSSPVSRAVNALELRNAIRHGEVSWNASFCRWLATTTPRCLSAYFATGVPWEISLVPALDSWVDLGLSGHWLLLHCMMSSGPKGREVALDVAIDGISQGRVKASLLGRQLGELMPSGLLKAKHLATTLSQLANASPQHARAAICIIAGGMRGEPSRAPRDLGALLSLLHELLAAVGERLEDEESRAWLASHTRGGQVATFRKRILAG